MRDYISNQNYDSPILKKDCHDSNIILTFDKLWMTGNATEDSPNYFALVNNGCIINRQVSDFKYHDLPRNGSAKRPEAELGEDREHSHEVLFSMKALQFAASGDGVQIYATTFVHAIVRWSNFKALIWVIP